MILIVDDKPENLFSLKTLLQLHAYEVDAAPSGEEALKKILRNEYALIILDVQMPGMDGYEVAETLTGYSKAKDIPIIFLSAVNIDKRFITKGYASGGVDYITKPFDPDLLMLKVKTFYRLYVQTKELKKVQNALEGEVEVRKQAQDALQKANNSLEEKVESRTRELVQMNQALEISNTELQQYASIASHDLQEPLRKIITFTNLILEKFESECPSAEPLMKKVIQSAERMRRLIDDLLNYSRLSIVPAFSMTDLNTILQESLTDLELTVEEKNARFIIHHLPHAEVIPGQMRQVFQNIIGNALKFSKEGESPEITIRSEYCNEKSFESRAVDDGPYLRIYISDKGIGFDEKFLAKIFTIFQRLHGKAEYEGTGIGLAIVRKIIEKHHGLITASSKENDGASFKILIPLRQSAVTLEHIPS